MDSELLKSLSGGADLLLWFDGRVPSFHDAEVLGVWLDRDGAIGQVKVHAFEITNQVDPDGYLGLTKHVVVLFEFDRVAGLNLVGFNAQNVINGLSITRTGDGNLRMVLDPCWGLAGHIDAHDICITLEPGAPPGSQYSAQSSTVRGPLDQIGGPN